MEWEEILKSIGARKSNWRLVSAELREISKKMREGDLLTGKEVEKIKSKWQSTDPFIDESGKRFVFYIHDRIFSRIFRSRYKFHFKWCRTLEQMDRGGRRARYKAKYDIENPFFGSSDDKKEKLGVCLNCLRSFSFNDGEHPRVDEFNMKEFFDTYGIQNLPNPTRQHFTHNYTKNWSTVANRYKQDKDWKCEGCGGDFSRKKSLLHAHHINGVKDDNSSSNLKSLCYECHSKEPGHEHLKNQY